MKSFKTVFLKTQNPWVLEGTAWMQRAPRGGAKKRFARKKRVREIPRNRDPSFWTFFVQLC
jgi:hypothetical protein